MRLLIDGCRLPDAIYTCRLGCLAARHFLAALFSLVVAILMQTSVSAAPATVLEIKGNHDLRAVYFIPNDKTPRITVQALFHFGEVDLKGPEGLSHYLEHLMFWHADGGRALHGRGGNAWVNGIVTTYYNDGHQSELDELFAFVARLFSPPSLDKQFAISERDVVMREYDLRVSENPDRQTWVRIAKALYPDHPLSRSVIGDRRSIARFSPESAIEAHRTTHRPENMTLIVSGPIEEAEIRKQLETFPKSDGRSALMRPWRETEQEGKLNERREFSHPNFIHRAIKTGRLAKWSTKDVVQDLYTAWVTEAILASSVEGGLLRALRSTAEAYSGLDVWINRDQREQVGFYFQGRLEKGVNRDTAKTLLNSELSRLGREGIPAKSLERIKKRLLRKEKRLTNSPDAQFGRLIRMLNLDLPALSSPEHLSRLEAVRLTEVNELLRAIAEAPRQIYLDLIPQGTKP